MERIVIGRTGLEAYRLGFGGIPIQTVSETQAVETVRHAIERGVDFIDTSRSYTTSERRIGLALQQTEKKVLLASKSKNRAADGIRQDLELSFKELQKDFIDLYQLHYVKDETEYRQVISSGGALAGLRQAKEEGLIGHIGITSHSLEILDRAVEDGLFDTIMVCFSFLECASAEKVIPKAIQKNIGVIAMKPFSGGFIEDARLALKYSLGYPGILVLAGVERKDLFDENWRIFQEEGGLTQGEAKEIEKLQRLYDKVFCRRCEYCQPCSEEIPIPIVINIRTFVKRRGKEILSRKGVHREAIEKARNCNACGECMPRCPYELPIPDLIQDSLRWVDEEMKSS